MVDPAVDAFALLLNVALSLSLEPSAGRFPWRPWARLSLLVLPCPVNELGEIVNRDLYKVKRDVFERKTFVAGTGKSPAKHGLGNRYREGR
jgi:hypothetical protein